MKQFDLAVLAKKAATWIQNAPSDTRFRVISHYDADGITAAAIISTALYRAGYNFQTTLMRNPFTKGLDALKNEQQSHIIFTDMGSGQIDRIKDISAEILIIDHHQMKQDDPPDHIIQLNANQCGFNGNYEACGATMSFQVAIALDEVNWDLAGFALAGATGDKQYIGGFSGLNNTIIQEALNQKIITSHQSLKLSQDSIAESLYYSVEPYYQGISGNQKAIDDLLSGLDIDNHQSYQSITNQQRKKLHSSLMLHLLKQGCESNILETVIRTRYHSERTYGEMEEFADLLDSCGKGGNRDLGLALCLGDKDSYKHAKNLEKSFKQDLLSALLSLDEQGADETTSFRYYYTDHTSLGGVIAGIAANFIFDKEKPLFSIAKKTDELHISCRGNQYLVRYGLDLGSAMSQVAHILHGHGGGHKIAAGATLPIDEEEEFIKNTDEILTKQLLPNQKRG